MLTPDNYFDELCNKFHSEIYRYLYRIAYDKNNVEDALQETFMEIYRNINAVMEMPPKQQRNYFYLVARHWLFKLSEREMKHQARREILEIHEEEILIEDFSAGLIEGQYWDCLFSKLTEKERDLIRDYYYLGYSLVEIAARNKESVSSAKMRLSRVKKKLKKYYEKTN